MSLPPDIVGRMDFTWQDGERTIRFGRGVIADAPELLGDTYVLLTTERAAGRGPAGGRGGRGARDPRRARAC